MKTKKQNKQIIDISGNDIAWWVDSNSIKELGEWEEERISDLLKDGLTSGELNISYTGKNGRYYETIGWSEKVNWRNIALSLYNAIGNKAKEGEAKREFDEIWEQL